MDLKPGYKQTAVGVIPSDWTCATVGRTAASIPNAIVGPFGSDLVSEDYVSDGVPVIRGQNMGSHEIRGPFAFVAPAKADSLSANLARPGDVVFTQRGTLGQVSLVPTGPHDRYLVSQSQMKVTLNTDLVDVAFFHCLFSGPAHQKLIRTATIQTGVPHINLGVLKEIPVQLPPLPEQQAIAAALGDVDALLGALDRLIAKKRDLKQAAMQQLLTGQTRLPGFNGKWEPKRLGEVGAFSKGKGIRKDDVVREGLPCVRYGEIYTHHTDVIRRFHSFISPEVAKESCRLQTGDIIFAGSGETAEEIGKCVAFLGCEEAYVGGDTILLRPAGHNSTFLAYLLNHPSVAIQKARMGQGDAVVHISARNLSTVQVSVPTPEEQAAIAQVLSEMDTEMAALERRREKTRLIKQGMMQELLTGRTRLV